MKKKILILLGPPGVGKGTVGNILSENWKVPIISSGDLLRESVKKNLPLGKKAKIYMDKGELVPDEIVVKIVVERANESDCKNGFILDGFPRNCSQAQIFEKLIKNDVEYKAIYLKAEDDFLIKRLADRRVCKNCGMIYHLINLPPKRDGVCDRCGGELIQREDDTPTVIKKRLEVYYTQTTPLLDYYKMKGILEEIPGDGKLQDTVSKIEKVIQW